MNYEQVVNRIKARVTELGLKMEDFYRDCHISSSALSQWKTGKATPTMASLQNIAAYLRVKVSYLLDGKNIPASVSADGLDSINLLSPELLEELSRFVRLAKANPERALRFLSFANQEIESQL